MYGCDMGLAITLYVVGIHPPIRIETTYNVLIIYSFLMQAYPFTSCCFPDLSLWMAKSNRQIH
jgi:hypothetical protein